LFSHFNLILQANGILYVFLLLQVLALDKRFLDPRRTLNPSQAEKEEGIIPLTDSLPIIPQVYFHPRFPYLDTS
jgi:hypothetical protein